jgi:hypothetical protein
VGAPVLVVVVGPVVVVVVVGNLVGVVRLNTGRVVREGRVVVDTVVVGWVLGGHVCLVDGVLLVYTGLIVVVGCVFLTYSVVVEGVPLVYTGLDVVVGYVLLT